MVNAFQLVGVQNYELSSCLPISPLGMFTAKAGCVCTCVVRFHGEDKAPRFKYPFLAIGHECQSSGVDSTGQTRTLQQDGVRARELEQFPARPKRKNMPWGYAFTHVYIIFVTFL